MWANENPHWHVEANARSQAGERIMAWAGIIGNDMIGPFFFTNNVTGPSYLEMLHANVLPALIDKGYNIADVIFQHDGAPAHNEVTVRGFLDQNFPKWIGRNSGFMLWPARSPDLTPLDYFLWGTVKDLVYQTRAANMDELQEKIIHACNSITADMLENTRLNFRKRLHWLIHKQGGLIEPSIRTANL